LTDGEGDDEGFPGDGGGVEEDAQPADEVHVGWGVLSNGELEARWMAACC
jgi:hypothetical protein